MISANELRIGNWLKVIKPNEGFQKVNPKTIFNILYANDDAEYKPIPLTPEILIAAGFKQSDEFASFYRFEDFDFEFCFGSCYYVVDDRGDNEGTKAREIKYLHQLQNLYFALTGTELEINL